MTDNQHSRTLVAARVCIRASAPSTSSSAPARATIPPVPAATALTLACLLPYVKQGAFAMIFLVVYGGGYCCTFPFCSNDVKHKIVTCFKC